MKALVLTLTFAVILSASGVLSAAEKVKLEHKLSVGDRLVSENTMENYVWANFKQVGGPLFEQTGNIETTVTVDVVAVDENGVIETKVVTEASGAVKQLGGKTTLIPATEQPQRMFKLTKTGEVVWCDIGEYEPRHPQNPLGDIDDWLAYITVQQTAPLVGLPDKEVEVGDSWITETLLKSPDGGKLKMVTKFGLFALGKVDEHDCAWIQSEARLPFRFKFSGEFDGYSSVAVEGIFVWKGRSCFAYEEGRMVKDRSSWSFIMMVEIPLEEGSARSFFTTLGDSTSTTSLSR